MNDPWITAHSPLSPERQHALGFLTFAWNTSEYWTHAIFTSVLGVPEETGRIITHDLGLVTIWKKVIALARHKSFPADSIELLEHAKLFHDRCRINRNLFVHATGAAWSGEHSGLSLQRTKGQALHGSAIPDTLNDLRSVGESIDTLNKFLADVCVKGIPYPGREPEVELLDKPPLPEALWKPTPPPKQDPHG